MASTTCDEDRAAPPFLPHDAAFLNVDDDVAGWHYSLTDPYGDRFEFFIWHDGRNYQVSVVDPPLESMQDACDVRLSPDGRLQPIGREGYDSMFHCFLASVAWQAYRAITVRSNRSRWSPAANSRTRA